VEISNEVAHILLISATAIKQQGSGAALLLDRYSVLMAVFGSTSGICQQGLRFFKILRDADVYKRDILHQGFQVRCRFQHLLLK